MHQNLKCLFESEITSDWNDSKVIEDRIELGCACAMRAAAISEDAQANVNEGEVHDDPVVAEHLKNLTKGNGFSGDRERAIELRKKANDSPFSNCRRFVTP
jgi:hypothetical protein